MSDIMTMRIRRCLYEDMQYDLFRSEISHMLAYYEDVEFLEIILKYDFIRTFWNKKWYHKAFYILAILDYIADRYHEPYLSNYDDIRQQKLAETLFPQDILILEKLGYNAKKNAINECKNHPIGKYFYKYNLIKRNINNVR